MNKKKTLVAGLIGAALAGMIAGKAHAEGTAAGHEGASDSKMSAGAAAHADQHDAGKHDCKGKNSCKGEGGCKTGDHGCKGKNSCKGKGGCNTNHDEH